MENPERMKTTTVQLSVDLLEEIKKIAKQEGRSTSSQVRIFLDQSVTQKNMDKAKNANKSDRKGVKA